MKKRMHVNLMNRLLENTNIYVKQIQSSSYKRRRLTKASLEWSYHIVNPLLAVDAVSKIELRYGTYAVKTNKYVHQRQYFPNHLQYFRETNEIDVEVLREKLRQNLPSNQLVSTDSVVVNFLMALSGRPDNFIRFLQNFKDAFLTANEKVNLIVAFFPKNDDYDYKQTKSESNELIVKSEQQYEEQQDSISKTINDVDFIRKTMDDYQSEYPERTFKLIMLEKGRAFSRGVGLQEASQNVENNNEILFFCDVDLVFTTDLLTHIRRNTVQRQRVYYPVFFSQYDPDVVYVEKPRPPTHFSFEELDGFWRYFSYGMLSIYKSDFDNTTGFNTKIQGWGLEDVEMVRIFFFVLGLYCKGNFKEPEFWEKGKDKHTIEIFITSKYITRINFSNSLKFAL